MHRSEIDPTSQNLERYQPLLALLQFGTLIVGIMIWVEAWIGGGSAFRPETWGRWAHDASAEFWGAALIGVSTLSIIGLLEPPRRWMVSIGAAGHCLLLLFVGASAVLTGGDLAVAVFAMTALFPLHAWTLISNSRSRKCR